ncbi:uncharacterized protein LOC116438473 [Corvus moneduloides]|uniref:uncharacterized protein LOC116438473 n=1 Tax=Corvus moneduloides TaxID=1196302 RepID=UPI0013628396|nr:uncharacterized protein LOC116438473 [Corvus moneduloides]
MLCQFNTAWFLVGMGEKLLETSMSGTEPIAEGSDDGQVTSPIRQVGNASVMTYLRQAKLWEAQFLLLRGGEAGRSCQGLHGWGPPETETMQLGLPVRCRQRPRGQQRKHGKQFPNTEQTRSTFLLQRSSVRSLQLIELENKNTYGQHFSSKPEKREEVRTCKENQHGGMKRSRGRRCFTSGSRDFSTSCVPWRVEACVAFVMRFLPAALEKQPISDDFLDWIISSHH